MNNADFLRSVDIFSLLNEEEMASVLALMKTRRMKTGDYLFREGDEGNELYIVCSGMVGSSIRLPDGRQREIATFGAGNFFGEMSIFDTASRSATCYCKEDCELLCLHASGFYELIEHSPAVSVKIMYRMLNITTQRLRDTGQFLSDMVHWGEAARKRAITDELTGVYNRRFLDDALESHFEAARTGGTSLSLVMVDLDHFREINDMHGHEAGDRLLLQVVAVFTKHLRPNDILARYGGDEFTVLMPDTGTDEALAVAEGIRRDVAAIDSIVSDTGAVCRVTTSQGIATVPDHAADARDLREKADRALYRAKEEGRDRIICAE